MRFPSGCFVVLLITVFASSPMQADTKTSGAPPNVWSSGGTHPVTLAADADTATCNECHRYISQGKYVHTAISMGCTACHQVKTEKGVTTVTLLSPVNQLCLTCHTLESGKSVHRPYKLGDCIVCHSPHASDFPAHTWVAHQDTCLGCHARARLKVNAKNKTVIVPWGATLTFDQMQGWMYLNLDKTLTKNHPLKHHPVSGPNTAVGGDAPPISCLTCHHPHVSTFTNLMTKTPPDPGMFLCQSCALCMDCHKNLFP